MTINNPPTDSGMAVEAPIAVWHDIDAVTFELRPDGELALSGHQHKLIRFDPREVYAIAMFLRLPSVQALLEREHTQRMNESEISLQETLAQEAAAGRR
jgi:hypothetical protein